MNPQSASTPNQIDPISQFEAPEAFVMALETWFQNAQRKLPWRQSPSVYKTVLSEFMLQQTQVATVLPYFHKWLETFPTFQALAEASEAAVLKNWEGLGYYARARNLHKLAKAYTAADPKPTTAAEWLHFPGVGPYTSAAIASIIFNESIAVVDGNVIRILTRLTADATEFKDNTTALKKLTPSANALIAYSTDPGTHNQAMMELGATVCHKHKPLCLLCPVSKFCAAQRTSAPESYPKLIRKKTIKRTVNRLFIFQDGKLLLQRKAADAKRLANFHELPAPDQLNLSVEPDSLIATKTRGISNERITEHIYSGKLSQKTLKSTKNSKELIWCSTKEIDQLTLSGPHRRWINELIELELK